MRNTNVMNFNYTVLFPFPQLYIYYYNTYNYFKYIHILEKSHYYF